ncbi:MAG: hypothetical protein GY851_19735 [bacterium]|nr:hypothetical protein [bacterium]
MRLLCGSMCVSVLLAGLALAMPAGAAEAEEDTQPYEEKRWGKDIRRFEKADKESFPPEDAVLFVGSSSIVGWNLKKYFPNLETINRGFGGSAVSDSVYFADRIVLPYKPRVIVLYAGDNDIAGKKTPERVLKDYRAFVAVVRQVLPKTKIVFVAIKPSIARWELVDKMREANRLIEEYTKRDDRQVYVDIDTPMIGEDGMPRKELFKEDGLHLNHEGYVLWSSLVEPHLKPEPKGVHGLENAWPRDGAER